jgi:calcium-dependent protein kinase
MLRYCKGGDILTLIQQSTDFNEYHICSIMSDLMKAIIYCHNHHIVHRDIKAENILFEGRDISSPCKLIDFGISLKFTKDSKLKDKTGTILYVAPEVLKGSYDEKCDVWACGVLLYLILCGYPPFYGSSRQSVMRKILKEEPSFKSSVWKKVSPEAIQLIKLMLTKKPEDRPTS